MNGNIIRLMCTRARVFLSLMKVIFCVVLHKEDCLQKFLCIWALWLIKCTKPKWIKRTLMYIYGKVVCIWSMLARYYKYYEKSKWVSNTFVCSLCYYTRCLLMFFFVHIRTVTCVLLKYKYLFIYMLADENAIFRLFCPCDVNNYFIRIHA